MRRLLCGLALSALCGCYSASTSDEEGGAGGTSGSTSGGSASGGTTSKGGTTGRGGSSSAGSSSGGTGGTSDVQCDTVFAGIDKTCSVADDCVLVNHTADCCGTILIMGIAAGDLQSFSAAETYCSAQLPLCGCAAQGTNLEDGTIMEFGDTNYGAVCLDGQCGSVYTGEAFSCLTATCTATQYCQIVSGGPAGSGSTGSCFPLGGCTDCACINAVGCDCTETEGHITVACAAP